MAPTTKFLLPLLGLLALGFLAQKINAAEDNKEPETSGAIPWRRLLNDYSPKKCRDNQYPCSGKCKSVLRDSNYCGTGCQKCGYGEKCCDGVCKMAVYGSCPYDYKEEPKPLSPPPPPPSPPPPSPPPSPPPPPVKKPYEPEDPPKKSGGRERKRRSWCYYGYGYC